MATKLVDMPKRRGHPWDEWTDGSAWRIRRGEDFPGQLESMCVRLYSKAKELGKELEIKVEKEDDSIAFRFTDKTDDAGE